MLFQVLSQRHERGSTIITTNLPFGEWTSVFPVHRLCKALLDRLTYRAHIIDTGKDSMRFAETMAIFNKKYKSEEEIKKVIDN